MFELPKLKYLDWQLIGKEDRTRAGRMQADGLWAEKPQTPASPVSVSVRTPSIEVKPRQVQAAPSKHGKALQVSTFDAALVMDPSVKEVPS